MIGDYGPWCFATRQILRSFCGSALEKDTSERCLGLFKLSFFESFIVRRYLVLESRGYFTMYPQKPVLVIGFSILKNKMCQKSDDII